MSRISEHVTIDDLDAEGLRTGGSPDPGRGGNPCANDRIVRAIAAAYYEHIRDLAGDDPVTVKVDGRWTSSSGGWVDCQATAGRPRPIDITIAPCRYEFVCNKEDGLAFEHVSCGRP